MREALRTLAREQLVEVYPRRGIFVSSVDVRDLAGLSEVRLALETAAARLAAERATAEDRERCSELLEELERAADGHDERALIELDQRIHRHVYDCTHNAFLARTLEEYYILTLRIWFLALDRVARLEDAVREHRELLGAIRDGDRKRAEDVMRRHVDRFRAGDQRGVVSGVALVYALRRADISDEEIHLMSSTFPATARAVVIGCGIVGNSLAYHLTEQGWTDVLLIDKGPLPNPGGSTGHASNFIFPVDHSKEMTMLTLESQRQYV